MIRKERGSPAHSAIIIITVLFTVLSFSLAVSGPLKEAGFAALRAGGINAETYYFFLDEAGELSVFSGTGDSDDSWRDRQRFCSFQYIDVTGGAACLSQYCQSQKSGTASNKESIQIKLRI